MHLKPLCVTLLLAACAGTGFAQRMASKTNILFGPMFKSVRTIQEIKTGSRFTTQTTVKVRPGGAFSIVPAAGIIRIYGVDYKGPIFPRLGGGGNVTEFRIYSKKKGAMHGFYFGPYASYSFFQSKTSDIPVQFTDSKGAAHSADMVETLKLYVVGGGLQMGVQGWIGSRVPVDWTILGFGFGSMGIKGTIEAKNTSDGFDFHNYMDDQGNVRFGIEKLIKITKTVENTVVSFDRHLPCPMLRMGLSVGFGYGMAPKLPKHKKDNDDSSKSSGSDSSEKKSSGSDSSEKKSSDTTPQMPDPKKNDSMPDPKQLDKTLKENQDSVPNQQQIEKTIKDNQPKDSDKNKDKEKKDSTNTAEPK